VSLLAVVGVFLIPAATVAARLGLKLLTPRALNWRAARAYNRAHADMTAAAAALTGETAWHRRADAFGRWKLAAATCAEFAPRAAADVAPKYLAVMEILAGWLAAAEQHCVIPGFGHPRYAELRQLATTAGDDYRGKAAAVLALAAGVCATDDPEFRAGAEEVLRAAYVAYAGLAGSPAGEAAAAFTAGVTTAGAR
jgi:hypothetical protein